jgi:hypothetical protein
MGWRHHIPIWEPIGERATRWDKASVIAAVQRWEREVGRPPTQADWKGVRGSEWPSSTHTARLFGTWGAALAAAGFPLPERKPRRKPRPKVRPTTDRFLSKYVVAESGCWEWQGSLDRKGYGEIHAPGYPNNRVRAHRFSYELFVGPIPRARNIVIDHLCRNPRCVNPQHLEVVTQRENVIRGLAARRAAA